MQRAPAAAGACVGEHERPVGMLVERVQVEGAQRRLDGARQRAGCQPRLEQSPELLTANALEAIAPPPRPVRVAIFRERLARPQPLYGLERGPARLPLRRQRRRGRALELVGVDAVAGGQHELIPAADGADGARLAPRRVEHGPRTGDSNLQRRARGARSLLRPERLEEVVLEHRLVGAHEQQPHQPLGHRTPPRPILDRPLSAPQAEAAEQREGAHRRRAAQALQCTACGGGHLGLGIVLERRQARGGLAVT